jgi:hypothetical protein
VNPIRHVRRLAAALAGLAGALLAFAAAAPAALARPGPPRSWQLAQPSPHPLPPGWYKHPPLRAAHVHQVAHVPVPVRTVVTGGMPGWQIALISFGAALLAAAVAVLADRAWAARRKPAAAAA